MEVRVFKFSELLNMTSLSGSESQDKLPAVVLDVLFNILADTTSHLELQGIQSAIFTMFT